MRPPSADNGADMVDAKSLALWLADREGGRVTAPPHELARLALHLGVSLEFRQHLNAAGAEAASHESSAAVLAATAIRRLGHAATDYLARLDASQRLHAAERLEELQALVVEALIQGHSSVVALSSSPTKRERQLTETIEGLDRINAAINSSLELEEVLRLTVESVGEVLDAPEVTIYLYDPAIDRLILRGTRSFNPEAVGQLTLSIGEGIVGEAAKIGRPVPVRDVWSDPRFKYVPGLGEERLRSFLAVPIVLFTVNRLIGVLNVTSTEFRDFAREEIRFTEIAAGHIAIAVENARLHGETDDALHGKVEQLTSVQNLARTLASNLDLQSVLAQIARQAAALTGMEKAAIWRVTDDELRIITSFNLGAEYARHRLALGEGAVGRAVQTRAPVVVPDALNSDLLSAPPDLVSREGYRAMFSVPLITGDDVLGAVSLYSQQPGEISQEQVDLAFTFGNHAAIAMENARLFEEARSSLESQSLLLQELHHRVKNNMQTIKSLLEMQARRAQTDEAAELLKLSAGRIAGMAQVHDLLSRQNIGLASVGEIIEAMVTLMRADLAVSGRSVEIQVEAASAQITSDKASVFALIVNELLWNALQHGLEGRPSGKIHVTAEVDGPTLIVAVADNGRGLPPGFDLESDLGLGLSIVRNLSERNLEGAVAIAARDDGPGAVATLRFAP